MCSVKGFEHFQAKLGISVKCFTANCPDFRAVHKFQWYWIDSFDQYFDGIIQPYPFRDFPPFSQSLSQRNLSSHLAIWHSQLLSFLCRRLNLFWYNKLLLAGNSIMALLKIVFWIYKTLFLILPPCATFGKTIWYIYIYFLCLN